jgi:hypothetical protein
MEIGSYADGRRLTYSEQTGAFGVGEAPVSTDQVRGYDAAGQIRWDRSDLRDWFYASFPQSAAPVAAALPGTAAVPVAAASKGRRIALGVGIIAGVVVLILLAGGVLWLRPRAATSPDDPALAAKVWTVVASLHTASGAVGSVRDVSAKSNGTVTVALMATAGAVGDSGRKVGDQDAIEDAARFVAVPILKGLPKVTQVSVVDGNGSLVDAFKR